MNLNCVIHTRSNFFLCTSNAYFVHWVLKKLNVVHLALTNDEGWRLEIPGLEELTTVGSKRCFGE